MPTTAGDRFSAFAPTIEGNRCGQREFMPLLTADAGRLREWVSSHTHMSEQMIANKTRLALVGKVRLGF